MSTPRHHPGKGDILIVDDTPENIRVLGTMLKQDGYRVRAVTSGALALDAVRTEAPDLILLDVSMPQMDGYEVCRRLQGDEALRAIPVLFLSALSETHDKVEAFAAGGVDYVTKPFRVEEIVARIETHLALQRLQRELRRNHEELQRSFSKLEELERIRQALVQMIVHDLKNPLAAIKVNASIIRGAGELKGDLAVAIEDICGAMAVEAHGGTIGIEGPSTSGSVFVLRLPVEPAPGSAQARAG